MKLTRRLLLQEISAFAASSALAATATGKIVLTNTAWTDLGAGPLQLLIVGDGVYAISDTTPALPPGEGFTMRQGKSAYIDTPSHIWAMARGSVGASAYISPFTGGSGATSVWSASDAAANGMTLSNGGLTATPSGVVAWQSLRSSVGKTSGKLYVEFSNSVAATQAYIIFGLASSGFNIGGLLGSSNYSVGIPLHTATVQVSSGFTANYVGPLSSYNPNSGDVFALAIDFAAGSIWFAGNNTWANSSNPATGTLPIVSFTPATVGALFAAMSFYSTGVGVWTLQATAASQKYAAPSGFTAWDGGVAPPPTSVWSASDATASAGFLTLSNGGLTARSNGSTPQSASVRTTNGKTSGKVYVEFLCDAMALQKAQPYGLWGLASAGFNVSSYLGTSNYSAGVFFNAQNFVSTGFTSNYTIEIPPGILDVWALAVDFAAGSIWISQNNVWLGGGNPVSGASPIISFTPATVGTLFAAMSFYYPNDQWTLQSTAASQKYAPPSGFSAWDSAAPTNSPQALAYLARTVGGNEGGNGANIATLIDGLVADGVWAKLDALYVLAQQNVTDAVLNLIGTSYSLAGSLARPGPRSVPFTPYVGFGPSPTNPLDTTFNPSTATSPHFILNSASFGAWGYAVSPGNIPYMSNRPINQVFVYTDNKFYARVNAPGSPGVASSITKGLLAGERADASNVYPYQNGVSAGPIVSASSGVGTDDFYIGGSPDFPSDAANQIFSAAFIGASLGSAGQLALYTRLRTYMTAVGVP